MQFTIVLIGSSTRGGVFKERRSIMIVYGDDPTIGAFVCAQCRVLGKVSTALNVRRYQLTGRC